MTTTLDRLRHILSQPGSEEISSSSEDISRNIDAPLLPMDSSPSSSDLDIEIEPRRPGSESNMNFGFPRVNLMRSESNINVNPESPIPARNNIWAPNIEAESSEIERRFRISEMTGRSLNTNAL